MADEWEGCLYDVLILKGLNGLLQFAQRGGRPLVAT